MRLLKLQPRPQQFGCLFTEDMEVISSDDRISPTITTTKTCGKELLDDLAKAFDKQIDTDVTIVVEGREIKAHKWILKARSTVFTAMFEHNLIEKEENRITIVDIEHDVMNEMVRFLYTSNTPNITELALGLLIAADKYDLQGLKHRCEKNLTRKLSVENAIDTLILADKHNARYLEHKVLKFIDVHYNEVCLTKEWSMVNADLLRKLISIMKN